MIWALSFASLSAFSRISLCSASVRASHRRFDRWIRTRAKSSSEISAVLSKWGNLSSNFVPKTDPISRKSVNRLVNLSLFFLDSVLLVSRRVCSSCDRASMVSLRVGRGERSTKLVHTYIHTHRYYHIFHLPISFCNSFNKEHIVGIVKIPYNTHCSVKTTPTLC